MFCTGISIVKYIDKNGYLSFILERSPKTFLQSKIIDFVTVRLE